MQSIKTLMIDPEFEALIYTIESEERNDLLVDILERGCLVPIFTWNNTIIDGHNRYKICRDNNIPFKMEEMQFEDRDAAKIWIITNQIARRNLSTYRKFELVKERERIKKLREDGKEKQLKSLLQGPKKTKGEKATEMAGSPDLPTVGSSEKPMTESTTSLDSKINTQKEVAKEIGVSHGTVSRAAVIKKEADEGKVASELIQDLRKGKKTIGEVYKNLKGKDTKGKGKTPSSHGVIYSDLNFFYSRIKDMSPEDIESIQPLELRQRIMNKMDVVRVKLNDLLGL